MKKTKLAIKPYRNASGTVVYRVSGWLNGERVRKNFKNRLESRREKNPSKYQSLQATSGLRNSTNPFSIWSFSNSPWENSLQRSRCTVAEKLTVSEPTITAKLNTAQGKPIDICGYYHPDDKKSRRRPPPNRDFQQNPRRCVPFDEDAILALIYSQPRP